MVEDSELCIKVKLKAKIVSMWEIPQSQTADEPCHQGEEPHNNQETPGRQKSKATSSLFPIKTIAKLKWTKSNAKQNIELLQNPTIGVTINNESTTAEPSP